MVSNDERQFYKFGGKELDGMHGLNMYDQGARFFGAVIPITGQPDPHAESYYHMSPYSQWANNPVNMIDPDGRDIWEINEMGNIVNREKDKTQDAFYMVAQDAEGNYQRTFTTDEAGNKNYNSISFEYGTVESQKTNSFSSDGNKGFYDVYQVRGDNNGTALFEFLGNHVTGSSSMVEIGQAKTGIEGDKGLNFITTSHERGRESGMSDLLGGQLYYGYTVRELNHSHPVTAGPSDADLQHKTQVIDVFRSQGLRIPNFNIYYIPTKTKIGY